MRYEKQDAIMTRGFAILCMMLLHLFCRLGTDVYGTPILWINQNTPTVYWLGFYAEICVSLYSISMGYAQYLLYTKGKATWNATKKRILKILINYWIILLIFTIIGLFRSSQNAIPGTIQNFLLSLVLLYSYNGAWWFLNTYIIFLLIPPFIKFFPVKQFSVRTGFILSCALQVVWYLICKFGLWPTFLESNALVTFITKELYNLIGVFPSMLCGAFMCKGNIIEKFYEQYCQIIKEERIRKLVIFSVWGVLFVLMNLLHKAVLTLMFAILSFVLFNIWEKGRVIHKVFTFLGIHSTNIWLSHMFFLGALFNGLVQTVKYPLFMLTFLLILCILTSCIEMIIEKRIYALPTIFGRKEL